MKKTCFVIIGYGIKTDYKTGRNIDLDKTFRTIIEPVFKELDFICFRACDIKHSGSIDLHMYENILKADFVIADLSTLNPNVLYELGIRHAVRKNTTLIIAEKGVDYPFDLGHIVIDSYEHLGSAIDFEEVLRFQKFLKEKVISILDNPKIDSPLYTVIPNLQHPQFTEVEIEEIVENIEEERSLSDIISEAEEEKEKGNFEKAIELYRDCLLINPNDDFLVQRLALSIYKSKLPNEKTALFDAEVVLSRLKPETNNDPETLGLSGAINKRLYENFDDPTYLIKALGFYERGFTIKKDYYNGINSAFLYTLLATIENDKFNSMANYGQGIRLRKQIIDLYEKTINNEDFIKRDDKEWIYATLAEAYFGLHDEQDLIKVEFYENLINESNNGKFVLSSYLEQKNKLTNLINLFNNKYNK